MNNYRGTDRLRPRHSLRTVCLLWLLLLLAGCSFLNIAWRYADDMILARADDWLDLQPEQEQLLRQRTQAWLATARRDQLPAVAAFLEELADRMEDGFDAADAAWADQNLDALYRQAASDVIGLLVPTLQQLAPAQREHLAGRMVERNADYRAQYVDGEHQARARALADRIVEQVERWTGPLERQQLALVNRRVARLPDTAGAWYRYRLRMQAGLLARLEGHASSHAISAHLHNWWVERSLRRPGQVARTEALRTGILELLVDLEHALTPAQRVAAIRRMRSMAEEFDALSATQ